MQPDYSLQIIVAVIGLIFLVLKYVSDTRNKSLTKNMSDAFKESDQSISATIKEHHIATGQLFKDNFELLRQHQTQYAEMKILWLTLQQKHDTMIHELGSISATLEKIKDMQGGMRGIQYPPSSKEVTRT